MDTGALNTNAITRAKGMARHHRHPISMPIQNFVSPAPLSTPIISVIFTEQQMVINANTVIIWPASIFVSSGTL